MTMRARLAVFSLLPLMLWGQSSRQQPGDQKQLLRQVAFEQKLNAQLPLDLEFRDETGRTVKLAEYFVDKPVLLIPVYYECPMLCNLSMGEVVKTLRTMKQTPGKDFRVVMFSFDPKEKPELAAEKKKAYLKRYGRPETADGWTFLTGEEGNIKKLTDSIGYRTAYDPSIQQYAHAAGFVIATAQGKVSRYLFGLEYSARDVRLGLLESSQGKIGDPVGQLLLMCFHYDPKSGLYTMSVITVMRAAGVLTIACIGGFLIVNFRRERRQRA
jgi:protein SCO1/2